MGIRYKTMIVIISQLITNIDNIGSLPREKKINGFLLPPLQVQDAFRCRLRNCQDPINADSSSSFPNGHAQIMVSFHFPSDC